MEGRGSMRCLLVGGGKPLPSPTLQPWHGSISPLCCSGLRRADAGCSETSCRCSGQLTDGRGSILDALRVREEMATRGVGRSCLSAHYCVLGTRGIGVRFPAGSHVSLPILGPIQRPIQWVAPWVKCSGGEADQWPSYRAKGYKIPSFPLPHSAVVN
jgi:hypothetical protein